MVEVDRVGVGLAGLVVTVGVVYVSGQGCARAAEPASYDDSHLCEGLSAGTILCDNFERPDAGDLTAGGRWGGMEQSSGLVVISLEGAGHVLRASIDPGATGSAYARLVTETPAEVTEFHATYKIEVDDASSKERIQVMGIVTHHPNNDFGTISLFVAEGKLGVIEQTTPPNGAKGVVVEHALNVPVEPRVWRAVDARVVFGANPHLSLVVNGVSAYDDKIDAFFVPAKASLQAGISLAESPVEHHSVEVDDVVIEAR
jgi:hypothetical protein